MVTYNSDEAIADIPAATYRAIKDRFLALAPVADALGNERAALEREMKAREALMAEKARLGVMTDDSKDVLRAVVSDPNFMRR